MGQEEYLSKSWHLKESCTSCNSCAEEYILIERRISVDKMKQEGNEESHPTDQGMITASKGIEVLFGIE